MHTERRSLIIVTTVALVLRLAWVLSTSRSGFALNDSGFYHANAYNIAHGNTYGYPGGGASALWPPGYPALLALPYRIFGYHETVAQVCNALLGAVTVPLLFMLVKPRFGRRVAMIAAWMLAVMPGPILWTDMVLTETVYTLMVVVFFLLLLRAKPTMKWAIVLGVYIGLVALTRSEGMVWVLLLPVLWRRELPWRRVATRFVVAGAAVVLVLTPWSIRNSTTFHTFVPLSTNAGTTLWAGHNPGATGMQVYASKELLETFPAGPDWEVHMSRGLQHQAIDYMVHHPVQELKLIPKKLLGLMRGDSHVFDWLNQNPHPTTSPITATYISVVTDFAWFTLLALTLVGVIGLGRHVWRLTIMRLIAAMFIITLVLYGFLYYGNYRYRLPYEPLMMVVAALVIDRGWRGLMAARADDLAVIDDASVEPEVVASDDPE